MSSAVIREPTAQQRRAITATDRNVVVVAGAGTGKTFVLVRRFVALLEANPDWPISAVVAITFTNRAADEMRARVRTEFEQRRRAATDDASRRRWSELLAQIEAARITTIHGLCSEIVRANAAIAEVDPAFEVLDETQSAMLRADAVNIALAEVMQRGVLSLDDAALAGDMVARYGEQEIRDALKTAHLLSAELPPVRDVDALREEWELHADNLLTSHDAPMLDYDPTGVVDRVAQLVEVVQQTINQFFNPNLSLEQRLEYLRAVASTPLPSGQISVKKWPCAIDAKNAIKDVIADAKKLLIRIGEPPGEQDVDARALLMGWHILLERTRAAYTRLKQLRAALDYDDLERQAACVLAQPDAAQRYAGSEFRHVMVDEFQDTNRQQWEIVKRIAPPGIRGSLFIVGDPKQSIYSFRGADVTVFDVARHDIESEGGDVLYLTESFRTHKPLIDSLNELFETVLVRPPTAIEPGVFVQFDESQQLQSRRDSMPDGTYIATYIVPSNKASDEKDRLREARVAAQQIKRMVTHGDALVLDSTTREYRRPRYGDIALLLRSFKGRLEYFERAFNDEGIPYITLGGQGFYGRREVKDLLCALRALHNPADELELAAALHSPLFAVSDADLLLMRQPFSFEGEEAARTLPLYDALMALAAVRRAESTDYDPVVFSADVLTQLAPMVGRAPVEVLLQSLIHATGYMATLAGLPDGQQMRANVEKLIDRARDSGITALNLFVRHLNDMTEGEAKEGGVALQAEDAVRLTTIHSSKGLEYPIVWIADACSESRGNAKSLLNYSVELGCKMPLADQEPHPNGKKDAKLHPYVQRRNDMLAAERDDAETRRILYVAATRAQDALFISGVPNKDSIPGWLGMIAPHIAPEEVHPTTPPVREKASATQRVASGAPLDFPLARTLPAAPPPTRLHLSASDIKALGGHFSGPEDRKKAFTRRLRHRIFDETTEPVEMLTYSDEFISAGGRRFGTLVHDALRFGYDTLLHTDEAQVTALLEAMAWELGITQESELQKAVDNALQMLRRYRKSALARELDSAEAVYRELPFVYQRDGHVIHGYIDLLYRDTSGHWTVVDYKTDRVTGGHDGLQEHARIYCLQLAVYAEAVAAQTGQTPRAQLVYLQYPDAPVTFDSEALQSELEKVPLHTLIELLSTETS